MLLSIWLETAFSTPDLLGAAYTIFTQVSTRGCSFSFGFSKEEGVLLPKGEGALQERHSLNITKRHQNT